MVDVKVDEQNNGVEAAAQEILEEDEIEKEEAKKDAQKKMNSSEDEKAAAPNCDQAKDDEKILVGPGIPVDAEKEKTDTTAGLTPMKDPKAATESTNGEEDSPPAPPSVLRRNDHASLMTPGAYSVTPTVNDTNRTATATPPTAATSTTITGTGEVNTNINNPSPQVATETDDEEQGLAVAKPVDGGIPDNVAQPVDPEKKERDAKRREEKRKRRHIWFSIGSVVIISLAVFLAVFFVSDDEDNSSINLVETSTDSPTPSPVVPEPPPEEILTTLLPDDTVRLISFEDSSQGKAFRWVTEDPNFRSYSEKRLQQRFALATFWYATGDETWGPNWLNMSQHECTWEHFMPQDISFEFLIMRKSEHKFFSGPCLPIGLNYSTATLEETTASSKLEHDDILYLGLYQRQLSGQIPREITMLTSLKMLMLEETTLEGTIPEVLTQLTSLHDLTLAGTNLHGTIPTEFSLMKELRTLIIGANRGIEGTLPTELGLLPNIKTLNVYETNVTGPIPIEYTKLPLEEMQIHNNFLTGTIPTEYGLLTKADWLAIELNQLTGTLPTELGNLKSLWLFYLYYNRLTGTIPTEIGRLIGNDFEQIYLMGNRLTGTIPTELGQPNEHFWRLRLESNFLTGTIPSEIGLLTHCSTLGVAHNLLTGIIPNEVAAISPMEPNQQGEYMGQYIRYNDNQLTGTLAPDFFRNNQSLMLHASFENNQFSGSLPSEIGYWTGLSYFTIHNNILTGPIPSEIGTFQSLGTLSLGANNWSGTFHSELGLLVTNGTINTFNISRSQTLTGTLPEEFCDWISDVSLDRVLAFDCGPVCDCDCNCSETNA